MASLGSLGSLVVSMAVDTAKFQGDLGRAAAVAEAKMRRIRDTTTRAIGAISAVVGAGAGVLGAAIKSAINEADNLSKTAQKVGVTTEALSGLQYAAKLSGVELSSLQTALTRLSKNTLDSARGIGEAVRSFSAIGIAVKNSDGSLKSSDQLLSEIADKFKGMQDGAAKTAIAVELLGRSGADLIPLLNGGSEAIKRFTDEAAQMGIIISTDTGKKAEEFNDTITRIQTVLHGMVVGITAEALPALQNIASALLDYAKDAESAVSIGKAFATLMKLLTSAVLVAATAFTTLGKAIGAYYAILVSGARLRFSEAASIAKEAFGDIAKSTQAAREALDKIWSPVSVGTDELAASLRSTQAEFMATSAAAKKAGKVAYTDYYLPIKGGLDDILISAEKLENTRLDQFGDSLQQIGDDMEKNSQVFERQVDEISTFADQAARNMQDAFAEFLFDPFKDGLKGMLNSFIDVIRRMAAEAAAAAIFKKLFGGGESGGLGDILSKFLPGFASGGSFRVGGGGGVDSQLVAFKATPGETVSVGKGGGGGGIIYAPVYNIAAGVTRQELLPVLQKNKEETVSFVFNALRRGALANG